MVDEAKTPKAEAPKAPPKPAISGLKPATATAAAEQELHVHGSNFTMGSRLTLNGVEMPTRVHSPNELSTNVVMKEVHASTAPGIIAVTVRDGDTETEPSDWKMGEAKEAAPKDEPAPAKKETANHASKK